MRMYQMKMQHRRVCNISYSAYKATDDSGESQTLSDDEKKQKTTAQAFDDRLKGGKDMETVASAAGLTAQTATFDSESTSPDKGSDCSSRCVNKCR